MKEEDFIFNDEPLLDEDGLTEYNKRESAYNWRVLMSIRSSNRMQLFIPVEEHSLYGWGDSAYNEKSEIESGLACPCSWKQTLKDILNTGSSNEYEYSAYNEDFLARNIDSYDLMTENKERQSKRRKLKKKLENKNLNRKQRNLIKIAIKNTYKKK